MPTVIDALIMTLGLDVTGFKKGQKDTEDALKKTDEVSERTSKDMEAHGKRTESAFRSVKAEVLGLLAAFGVTVGMKEFITSSIQGQAALGRLSQNLGISARELEGWGVVSKEVGGTAEDALNSLQAVAGGLAEAAVRGHSDFTDAARANGVVLTDSTGKLLSYDQVLINISRRMAQLPKQQALWLANQLGVGSSFNLLSLGPDVLQQRLQAAEGLSRVTEESTRRAQELQRQWADLQQRFKGIRDIAFNQLEPVFIRLATRLANWLDGIDWDKVAKQVENLAGQGARLVDAMGGWRTAAIALGAVLSAKVLAPIVSLVANMGLLIPLLGSAASGISALGVAAGAGVVLLTAGAILHVDSLGGRRRSDGSYLDEPARNAGVAPGTDNAALWDKVKGRKSAYAGTGDQAALLLAQRMYVDQMSEADYRKTAAAILSGRIKPEDAGNAAPGRDLGGYFSELEAKNHLPAGLLQSVENAESGGGKYLTSPKGARGPFQLMPGTAAELGLKPDELDDTRKSAAAAATYLGRLMTMFGGDLSKTLAAYNAGPGNVTKYGGVPPFRETQDYVAKVLGGIYVGAPSRAASSAPRGASSTTTSETNIGTIAVYTQATDTKGIVRDMRRELQNHDLIAQADSGLQ